MSGVTEIAGLQTQPQAAPWKLCGSDISACWGFTASAPDQDSPDFCD